MRLRLDPAARRAIRDAAQAGYPYEVCGVLLGRPGDPPQVLEAVPVPNADAQRARDRYLLDPLAQLKAEKDARARGLEVLGYYHSHPDHPADASETDQAQSWEGVFYLIQAAGADRPGPLKAWYRPPGQARLQAAELD